MAKKPQYSFDPACLDLARHFYPDGPEERLYPLCKQFQDAAEGFEDESGCLRGCDDGVPENCSMKTYTACDCACHR